MVFPLTTFFFLYFILIWWFYLLYACIHIYFMSLYSYNSCYLPTYSCKYACIHVNMLLINSNSTQKYVLRPLLLSINSQYTFIAWVQRSFLYSQDRQRKHSFEIQHRKGLIWCHACLDMKYAALKFKHMNIVYNFLT